MHTPLRPLLIAFTWFASFCAAFAGPKLKNVASIPVRDAQFQLVRTLENPAEIEALLACLQRAEKIARVPSQPAYSHKIDLDDRWLYDVTRGEFTKLAHNKQNTYRLSEADRRWIHELIVQNIPNPPTPPAEPQAESAAKQ